MNKKYIVKTQGRVFDVQDKAYEVVAHNKNEAEVIAKNMFIEEYPVIDAQINTKASGISFATAIAIITKTAMMAMIAFVSPLIAFLTVFFAVFFTAFLTAFFT